jgi:hypothetical protein
MDFVAPSFLNNIPAVLNFNKVEEESEPKLKDFIRRIEAVESAVQDTTEKIESFMSKLHKLNEASDQDDDDKASEEDDGEESSSDDEQDYEIASTSLRVAETALFEAKRRIVVAEIAYREAELEFKENSGKILSSPAVPAKPTRKDAVKLQAETGGGDPFAGMLGLDAFTKNFLSLFVSAL